jgi:hypothetical protein
MGTGNYKPSIVENTKGKMMNAKRKIPQPGEQGLEPRDVSIELSNLVGKQLSLESTKAVAALAYKWLLEHKNTLLYSIAVRNAETFVISYPSHREQQTMTATELADLIVEDHIGGASPNPGT